MASNDDGFVVSSLKEANELFKAGFADVLYGVPLGVDKIGLAEELLMKNYDLQVFVDSLEILELMMAKSKKISKWSIFIKIDCENGRAGIKWNDEKLLDLVDKILKNPEYFKLTGLYAHCGNTYSNNGDVEVALDIARLTASRILEAKTKLIENFTSYSKILENLNCGIGSTPTCSLLQNENDPKNQCFKNLTELHAGNYTFYDVMQEKIGSCQSYEVAAKLLGRVISIKNDKSRAIVDCGFTAISKQGFDQKEGIMKDRMVLAGSKCKSTELKFIGVSQEHGKIEGPDVEKLKIGDEVFIYPWHSCVFSSLFQNFFAYESAVSDDLTDHVITKVLPVTTGHWF